MYVASHQMISDSIFHSSQNPDSLVILSWILIPLGESKDPK